MQLPLQYFSVDAHFDTHVPAWHFWSCGHALPQEPQFRVSVSGETQFCEHSISPASGSHPHRPPVHCVLPAHVLPQEPQFELSDDVSMHPPLPHSVSPAAHAETHLPCEQRSPVGHGLPHPPQFFASALRLLQTLPQSVCPVPQTQLPPWHVAPPPHWTSQSPQLFGSVCVFTHAVPQKVRLALGHDSEQTPLMQAAPCGQPPQASVPEDFLEFLEEHPGMGRKVAVATASAPSRIDDRTRLLVWFAMTNGHPSKPGALRARPAVRPLPPRMTRAPWCQDLETHGLAHNANAPQFGSAAHAVTIGLSHGAAPPSGPPRTSPPMHISHASPAFGDMGDMAHAEAAHAPPHPPVVLHAHVSSAVANVWYPDAWTCAQHCWHCVFVERPAHVWSVGPLCIAPIPPLLPLVLPPLLPPLGVIVLPLLPTELPPLPVPVGLPEQPVLYAAKGRTKRRAMPNAFMHFTVIPPMSPLRRERGGRRTAGGMPTPEAWPCSIRPRSLATARRTGRRLRSYRCA
jgi:hypothetical protein